MTDQKLPSITKVRDRDRKQFDYAHRKQQAFRQLQLAIFAVFAFLLLPACGSNTPKSQISEGNIATASSPPSIEKQVVKHALGEIQVPANPQRVVVLNIAPLDTALALGIQPIGAVAHGHGFENFPGYLSAQTEEIALVGVSPQPNLEKILLLKPDLIVGDAQKYHHVHDKLSQIAPTFVIDSEQWKEKVLLYSEALGQKQKAEELLAEYNSRIEKLRQELGSELANTKVSVITTWNGNIWVLLKNSLPGEILDEIGLGVPPVAQKKKVGFKSAISRESLDSIDSDVIFLLDFGSKQAEDRLNLSEFTSDPMFSELKAVKQGRVYPVDGETWGMGNSIQAANLVLDDLFKYLVEER